MENKSVTFTTYILSMVIVALAVIVVMLLINKGENKTENNQNTVVQQEETTQQNQNKTNQTEINSQSENTTATETSQREEDYFILYKGREIQKNIGIQTVTDMNKNADTMQKYNIVYYNFELGRYVGETQGNFGAEETYEGQSIVSNVSDFAISKKYNAMPSAYSVLNELPRYLKDETQFPAQLNEIGERITVNLEDVKAVQVDLDGDLRKEYIVCWKLDIEQGEFEDSRAEASSGFMLYDSSYTKVTDLCSIRKEFNSNEQKKQEQVFFTLDDIEFIDIDNDGIMEIFIELPAYEGSKIAIYKYNGGNISGEINYEVSLEP